jgi:PhnB protein
MATPYLNFDGTCAEAFRFYERVLDGKIEFITTFAEAPAGMPVAPGMEDRVLHVRLAAEGALLMGSDCPPGLFQPMQGLLVALEVDSAERGQRIFDALAEGGRVQMPFQPTFWAERFGMVGDRFGTPWMISYTGAVRVGHRDDAATTSAA